MARAPRPDELRSAYQRSFDSGAEERRLVGAVAFGATFALTRTITHAIRAGRGPFRNVTPGGRHIHHMTFGICALIGVGWAWLNEIGIGSGGPPLHEPLKPSTGPERLSLWTSSRSG